MLLSSVAVLLTNQDKDSNTVFTLMANPEDIQPLLLSFASIRLARLVILETPVYLIEYPLKIIYV